MPQINSIDSQTMSQLTKLVEQAQQRRGGAAPDPSQQASAGQTSQASQSGQTPGQSHTVNEANASQNASSTSTATSPVDQTQLTNELIDEMSNNTGSGQDSSPEHIAALTQAFQSPQLDQHLAQHDNGNAGGVGSVNGAGGASSPGSQGGGSGSGGPGGLQAPGGSSGGGSGSGGGEEDIDIQWTPKTEVGQLMKEGDTVGTMVITKKPKQGSGSGSSNGGSGAGTSGGVNGSNGSSQAGQSQAQQAQASQAAGPMQQQNNGNNAQGPGQSDQVQLSPESQKAVRQMKDQGLSSKALDSLANGGGLPQASSAGGGGGSQGGGGGSSETDDVITNCHGNHMTTDIRPAGKLDPGEQELGHYHKLDSMPDDALCKLRPHAKSDEVLDNYKQRLESGEQNVAPLDKDTLEALKDPKSAKQDDH